MFTLKMQTANSAFLPGGPGDQSRPCAAECARILRDVADKLEAGNRDGSCRDANGNRVGSWALTGIE